MFFCPTFGGHIKEEYSNYEISCSIEEIDTYLVTLSVNDLKYMQAVKYISKDAKDKLIKYKVFLKKSISNSNHPDEAEILMSRWIELECYEKDLMSDSSINNLFPQSDKESILYKCLICMRIARGTAYSYLGINSILQEENETLIKGLSENIHLFATYEDLLLMYKNMKDYSLYRSLVRHLVSEQKGRTLSVKKVLPLYKEISSALNIQIVDLLADWSRWSKYFKKSITDSIIPSMPIEFFNDTQELQHLEIVSHCRDMGKKYLQSISSDEWKEIFSKNSYEYQLLISLGCDCPNALEAFKQTIKFELEERILKLSDASYLSLVSFFKAQGKKWDSVYQNVRDRYGEMGADITIDLFKRYGKSLISFGKLSENHNAIRTLLPTSLIMNTDTLGILMSDCNKVAQILNSVEKEYKQEFCDEVLSVYKSKSEIKDAMKELMVALKIKFPSGDSKDSGHS